MLPTTPLSTFPNTLVSRFWRILPIAHDGTLAACITVSSQGYLGDYLQVSSQAYSQPHSQIHWKAHCQPSKLYGSEQALMMFWSILPRTYSSSLWSILLIALNCTLQSMFSRTLSIVPNGTLPAYLTVHFQISSQDALQYIPKNTLKYTPNYICLHTPRLHDNILPGILLGLLSWWILAVACNGTLLFYLTIHSQLTSQDDTSTLRVDSKIHRVYSEAHFWTYYQELSQIPLVVHFQLGWQYAPK